MWSSTLMIFLKVTHKLCFRRFLLVAICFLVSRLFSPVAAAETSREQFDRNNLLNRLLENSLVGVDTTGGTLRPPEDANTPQNARGQSQRGKGPQHGDNTDTGDFLARQAAAAQNHETIQSIMGSAFPPYLAVAPDFARTVDEELPQVDPINSLQRPNEMQRELWRARIGAPKDKKSWRGKSKLQQLVDRIGSIEFRRQKEIHKPVIAVGPVVAAKAGGGEPGETGSAAEHQTEIGKTQEKTEPKIIPRPYNPVTDRTLKTLEKLSEDPEKVNKPFELAEILFLSGHPKEAAIFYEQALNRRSLDDLEVAEDRAWILFQIGNCLKNIDRATAMKMYRQLMVEHANSPWVDFAGAEQALIDWYQTDKPRTVVAESRL